MYFFSVAFLLLCSTLVAQDIMCVNPDDHPHKQQHRRRHHLFRKYTVADTKNTNLLPSRRSKASLQSKENIGQTADYQLGLSSENEEDEDDMLESGFLEIPYIQGPSNQLQTFEATQYRLLSNGDFYCTHCGYAFHNPHKECQQSHFLRKESV